MTVAFVIEIGLRLFVILAVLALALLIAASAASTRAGETPRDEAVKPEKFRPPSDGT